MERDSQDPIDAQTAFICGAHHNCMVASLLMVEQGAVRDHQLIAPQPEASARVVN
jgi:hypothetical protein